MTHGKTHGKAHGKMKNWTMKTTARSAAACGLVVVAALSAARAGQTPAAPATAPVAEAPASEPDRPGDQTGENAGDTLAARVDERFNVLSHEVAWMDGTTSTLERYRGKVLLLVNTASRCGLTPQYEALERIYKQYQSRGLVVIGFPANNFMGQEPGTNEEIAQFCTGKFGVSFPLSQKVSVKGEDCCPLYRQLAGLPGPMGGEPEWNFSKVLVDRDGYVIAKFRPQVTPDDPAVRAAIIAAMGKPARTGTPTPATPAAPEAPAAPASEG